MKLRKLTSEQRGFLKGVLGTSLVFAAGTGIYLYLMYQRYEDNLRKVAKDTARDCLDVAAEHYEGILRRNMQTVESAVCDNGEPRGDCSETTDGESKTEEWEALEKKVEQACEEHRRIVQDLAEKDAECREELDRLRRQIYADNDRLNKECAAGDCNHANV